MIHRMNVSPNCAAITKQFEGCQLEAYQCPAEKWTIGYGHTGPDVYKGLKIDQARADQLLMLDLQLAQNTVNNMVDPQVNQNQFDALCDFVFNCGSGNFKTSTLLKLVNESKFEEAALEFAKWTKGGGKVLPGLVKRRKAEADLFSKV
jgi:lysozyme